MQTKIITPKLGLTMEEVTIIRWLKSSGDTVVKGEPLVEIQSDKVVMEIEAPVSGVLLSIEVTEGQTVPVETVIGLLGEITDMQ